MATAPRLAGVRALVTGATSGLGLEMARALAQAGAQVALAGRDRERAMSVADALDGDTIGIALDVRDVHSVRDGVAAALAQLGAIDLLVGNAGIGMRTVNPRFITDPQPFWEVTPAGYRDVLETKARARPSRRSDG